MSSIASQITSLTIVYSIVYSYADQRKHQSSASMAFVWGIHQGPVKLFPFDDVIMIQENAFENVVWKMAAICLGLNVLINHGTA